MEIRWYLTASPWRELVSGNGVKRAPSELGGRPLVETSGRGDASRALYAHPGKLSLSYPLLY